MCNEKVIVVINEKVFTVNQRRKCLDLYTKLSDKYSNSENVCVEISDTLLLNKDGNCILLDGALDDLENIIDENINGLHNIDSLNQYMCSTIVITLKIKN